MVVYINYNGNGMHYYHLSSDSSFDFGFADIAVNMPEELYIEYNETRSRLIELGEKISGIISDKIAKEAGNMM